MAEKSHNLFQQKLPTPILSNSFEGRREDIFAAATRKELVYMIKTTYLNIVHSTLHMSFEGVHRQKRRGNGVHGYKG